MTDRLGWAAGDDGTMSETRISIALFPAYRSHRMTTDRGSRIENVPDENVPDENVPDENVPDENVQVAPENVELAGRDWLALSLPGLIWGSSFYLIAEGLESFSPYLVSWLRIGIGMCVILSVPSTRRSIPSSSYKRIAVLGVVWMAVPLSLFALAEQRVSSSVTGMLNGANPIFTAVIAALIVRALPPARQLYGLTIGLAGVVLIAFPSWSEGASSAGGIIMILAALVCYGIALNVAGPIQRQIGSLPAIGRSLAIAFVLTTPFGLAALDDSTFEWGSAAAVAVLGALGTGLAFVLMASNAGKYGGTRASSTTYLIPGVSIFLGVVLRGENVEALAVVGSVVALAGAYLINSATRHAN
jgi:drug/metabolite transporter (DMT)-like permease